ncbi:MAG TPA: hypothetical protein VID50_12020 [Candidatus Eisenbacteria bacterium]|jgi:hypothetical protein
MFRRVSLPPIIEAFGLLTLFVFLPFAALVFGILVIALVASR